MSGDRDRAQVYAAEIAAFDGTDLERVIGHEAVSMEMQRVVRGSWWPCRSVSIRRMRSDARSSVTRCSVGDAGGGVVDIGIAEAQATLATASHELAHALAGVDHGHDAVFRCAYLDVVMVMTNADRPTGRGSLHVDQLRRAFEAVGLAVGERTWPEPPTSGGPIAL